MFHVSPPAVKLVSGRGSQPIDETLGLGKRCTKGFGVCLRCAILRDSQHISTKGRLLRNVTVLMECCESDKGIMPDCVVTCGMQDCVLSLVGCRTVCCHLWDAGLCVVTCGMPDCVLSLLRELYPNPVGVPYLGISGGKGQLLVFSSCCLSYLLLL